MAGGRALTQQQDWAELGEGVNVLVSGNQSDGDGFDDDDGDELQLKKLKDSLPNMEAALSATQQHCKPKKGGSKRCLRDLVRACWTTPVSEGEEAAAAVEESVLSSLPDDVLMECLARVHRGALHSSMMVCQRWRQLLKTNQYYDLRKQIGMLDSLLFVFGGAGAGLASAIYCKSSGGWKAGLLCTYRALVENEWLLDYYSADHALLHAQPTVMRNRIFILGAAPSPSSKWGGVDCTIIYDAWTKTLTRGSPMLCPRKKFACCVISNRIYVAGGANRNDYSRDAIVDAEEYIPELDVWKSVASMPRKRYGCLGAAVDGIFYVIGGLKFSSMFGLYMQPYAYVRSMDSYDPKTNSWQKTKLLPMGGCVIACTVVGSSIYMLSSHAVELSFWKYNTVDDSWCKIRPPPIPSPLRIDNYLKFSCATVGNAVYIIQVGGSIDDLLRRSGRNGRGLKEGLVLVYDTIFQEWSRGPDLPYVKNGAACAVVQC